jgi:hypothetical protein
MTKTRVTKLGDFLDLCLCLCGMNYYPVLGQIETMLYSTKKTRKGGKPILLLYKSLIRCL